MPKFRFLQTRDYNKIVSQKNCDALLHKIRILVDDNLNLLLLNEKQQLLYIVRAIEAQHQNLSGATRLKYNAILDDMLRECKKRTE